MPVHSGSFEDPDGPNYTPPVPPSDQVWSEDGIPGSAVTHAEDLPPDEQVEAVAADLAPDTPLEGGGTAADVAPDTPVDATADELKPGTETSDE